MDITIAIDAMGGDHGVSVTVPAAVAYLRDHPNDTIVLVGLTEAIESALRSAGISGERPNLRIHPATEVVGMDEQPQSALRGKKDSSMR
ncbi:MAG: phosphate acyltransferase, partial [Sideroxydans sp.]